MLTTAVAVRRLKHMWSVAFRNQNILILGAKATGKSSLILFMQKGKPYELMDGEIRPPDPTAAAIVVGRKVKLGDEVRAKVDYDIGGDPDLRHQWNDLIDKVQPDGIIYMLDGRLNDSATKEAVNELFQDVMSHYENGLRRLSALHLFVNFADQWMNSPVFYHPKIKQIEAFFAERCETQPSFADLRWGVSATQLSPREVSWSQATRALKHFATNLTSQEESKIRDTS